MAMKNLLSIPTYEESSFLFYSLTLSGRLFMLVYGIFCYLRLKRFTSGAKRESKFNNWLWTVFGLYCFLFLFILLRWLPFSQTWMLVTLTAGAAAIFVILQSSISFHILSRQYKLVTPENLNQPDNGKRKYTNFQETRYKSFHQKKQRVKVIIDRTEFENYFKLKKPYLDPKFKMDDLVETFKACRSIISSFINKTYHMSFSWYVNRWRLEEMDRLLKHESNIGKDPKKLALKAGFGSYRNYLRVKAYFSENNKTSSQ